MESAKGPQLEVFSHIPAPAPPAVKAPSCADTSSTIIQGASSSPVPVAPVLATSNVQPVVVSGSTLPFGASSTVTNVNVVLTAADAIKPSASVSESSEVSITVVDTVTAPMYCYHNWF